MDSERYAHSDPAVDALLRDGPVFDAHVDSLQRALDLGEDLGARAGGHFDVERAREGGLGSVVLVSWCEPVHAAPEGVGFRARTDRLIDSLDALLARHPDRLALATDGREEEALRRAGRVAIVAGIEGGHSIEDRIETLEHFFDRGVRLMTLVWNNHLSWIRSCQDGAGPDVPAGLSEHGRRIVRRMNELGMVVDLSHAGDQSFYDALDASERAPIASHSGCRALHDHPRNLTDDQLRALAAAGGVVGMVFCVPFLDAEARAEDTRVRESAGYAALEAAHPTELFRLQGEYLQRHARALPLERVLDHALHAIEVCGIEHVGLGSDFDGIQRRPVGLEDARGYRALANGLRARGLSPDELRLVLGDNMRRVFREATGPGTEAARRASARSLSASIE